MRLRGLSLRYVLRRLGTFVLTVWLAATMIFVIPRLMAGNPVAAMVGKISLQSGSAANGNAAGLIAAWNARFGLNDPAIVQYLLFLKNSVTFNFGFSITDFPATVAIALHPKLLVADEPTSALDVVVQRVVGQTLLDVTRRLGVAASQEAASREVEHRPSGCVFRLRCPHAFARCADEAPAPRETSAGHVVACHLNDGVGNHGEGNVKSA